MCCAPAPTHAHLGCRSLAVTRTETLNLTQYRKTHSRRVFLGKEQGKFMKTVPHCFSYLFGVMKIWIEAVFCKAFTEHDGSRTQWITYILDGHIVSSSFSLYVKLTVKKKKAWLLLDEIRFDMVTVKTMPDWVLQALDLNLWNVLHKD